MSATAEQIAELAAAIADQADAIATGRLVGPLAGATARLLDNARTLDAWARNA
jgi:hypothetical protein